MTIANDVEPARPPQPPATVSLEVLPREKCLALLASASVGRLGVSVNALPQILPVNFAMLGEDVVIRSSSGTKMDAAISEQVVAFEADDYSPDGTAGWSVLVVGFGAEIADPDDLTEAHALGLEAWALGDEADRYLRIEGTIISGRRFRRD